MFEFYFPDNKWEYLPAVISLLLCVAAAAAVTRLFKKLSQRELKKAKALEEAMQQQEVRKSEQ